jgi:mxaA protein
MSRGMEMLWIAVLLVSTATATRAIAAQQPAPTPAGERVVPAIVEQPRPFGYVVGDLLTQRVLLTTPRQNFVLGELPPVQRVNIWFERRAPRIEVAADGRRWLVIDYQLINSPPALATVQLPAWKIENEAHGARLEIPAVPISVAPLISASANTAGELRPDREPSIIDTGPARVSVLIWSIALAVTLLAWLAWVQWRNWRESQSQPFARALHQLRHIDESAPEAWQAVHRAFDQTGGRVLQIETLATLFERAPQLQPLRAEIERFFAQSNQRFFGAGAPGNLLSVRALCHELRQIERQHAQ